MDLERMRFGMESPFTYAHTAPEQANKRQPAIFLLHGMGSNEKDLPQLVDKLQSTHHIFSLRGPVVFDPGYAFFTNEEEGKPVRPIFDKVLLYIQSFIQEAINEFNLDSTRLYVVGFSQGAALAQTLGLTMGTTLRGVAALSGYLPSFVKEQYYKQPVEHLHIFISHGVYDYVLPYQWGEESKDYFEQASANVTFKTYQVGHGVSPDNQQDLLAFLQSLS